MNRLYLLVFLVLSNVAVAQIQPGFNRDEYIELLKVSQQQADTFLTRVNLPFPDHAERLYRSERMGLENAWEFWKREDGVGVISIHGTKPSYWSWMENFYSGMVPAIGSWAINNDYTFNYQLASDTNAYVHAGWLSGLAYLAPDILQKINEYAAEGVSDFIIVGHSQGGAIAFLLNSWLHYLPEGSYPENVRFKTYCSAAPKPGNLYYAYDFEYLNYGGWAFRVVHAEDWVPETPFSVQTTSDINERSPFNVADEGFKQLSPVKRAVVRSIYNGMTRATDKARDKFIKSLAYRMHGLLEERLPELEEPKYAESMAYITCGNPIILRPDPNYQEYLDAELDMEFVHHTMAAYERCAKVLPK